MGQILLTPEEIKQCEEDARRICTLDMSMPIDLYWLKQNLIKAQLKRMVKFIKTRAWQTGQYGSKIQGYLITEDDMQALLKEIE